MKPEDKKFITENAGRMTVREIAGRLGLGEKKVSRFIARNKMPEADIPKKGFTGPLPGRKFPASGLTLLGILALLTCLVYSSSINGAFLLDDPSLVIENPVVCEPSGLSKAFISDVGGGSGENSGYYRPLQACAYHFLYRFFKEDVRPYHILNMILHTLTALLVFWMIFTLFGDFFLSYITALFFSVFPAQSETVAYISATGDCLVSLFIVLSFVLYVRYMEKPALWKLILVSAAVFAAFFSKENALILPALFLLYHVTFRKRPKPAVILAVMVAACAYLYVRSAALGGKSFSAGGLSEALSRAPGFFAAMAGYAKIFFFPVGLNMGHDSRAFSFTHPAVIAGAVIVIAMACAAFRNIRRNPLIFFSIGWFFITILPVSGVYPIAFYMADHYIYLPSVGIFLIAGSLILHFARNGKYTVPAVAAVVIIAAVYSFLTVRQNLYWKDPITFFERTVLYNPKSFRSLDNLGRQYKKSGRLAEARSMFERAIEVGISSSGDYNNLGNVYSWVGDDKNAAKSYEMAITATPAYAIPYNNLANIYARTGRADDAEKLLLKAIGLKSDFKQAYRALASLYTKTGRAEKAAALCLKTIETFGPDDMLYVELGNAYASAGKYEEAYKAFEKAVELNPGNAYAFNNMGNIKDMSGDSGGALALYRKAAASDPGFDGAWRNIGAVCKKLGRDEESTDAYRKASACEGAIAK